MMEEKKEEEATMNAIWEKERKRGLREMERYVRRVLVQELGRIREVWVLTHQ
eukprot:SAG31_NODE_16675_length_700_cov_1.202995_1_plen_52_part_00